MCFWESVDNILGHIINFDPSNEPPTGALSLSHKHAPGFVGHAQVRKRLLLAVLWPLLVTVLDLL